MDTLEDRTAVITGGASGMGRAFAQRFAAAGARLVLADIEEPALDAAVAELTTAGADVMGVVTDVSARESMEALATAALDRYGSVNVVCLNAGVGGGNGPMDQLTERDWQWVLGVNLWGIIHGICAFLPHLKAHGDGHVVITASVAGLTSYPGMGPYNTSKHAAVAIAETLFAELREADSTVGVSCLCPGLVSTNIFVSDRNRPEQLRNPGIPTLDDEEASAMSTAILDAVAAVAQSPDVAAEQVHRAILDGSFWVYTDDAYDGPIAERLDAIRTRSAPPARGSILDAYS